MTFIASQRHNVLIRYMLYRVHLLSGHLGTGDDSHGSIHRAVQHGIWVLVTVPMPEFRAVQHGIRVLVMVPMNEFRAAQHGIWVLVTVPMSEFRAAQYGIRVLGTVPMDESTELPNTVSWYW